MRKRSIVTAVLVLIAVSLVLWLKYRSRPTKSGQPPAGSASGAPPAPTASHKPHERTGILAEILDHGLTPERAKIYFAMVVGPLPGVTVPPGSAGPSDFDGTLPISYLYQVWDSLTPEQRAAAERLIYMHPAAPVTTSASPASLGVRLALLSPSAILFDGLASHDYQLFANDANQYLVSHLSNISPIALITVVVSYDPPPADDTAELAHAWSWAADGSPDPRGCVITVYNRQFRKFTDDDTRSVMTHEVMHCFQERLGGTVANFSGRHKWVTEGEATWAQFTAFPLATTTGMNGWWPYYSFHPEVLYVNRAYDAVGVYGHLSDLAGNDTVWSRLLPVVQADLDTAGPLNVLTEGYQTDFYTNWGPSYFRVPSHKPWNMLGPGLLIDEFPNPQDINVTPDFLDQFTAGSDLGATYDLDGTADIVIVSLMTGYGRLADASFTLDTPLDSSGPLMLCIKVGGCKCPDGSPGASMFTKNATAPLHLGINGGETTAQVGVVGEPLDHFCQKPDPPQPPGGGGGGSGGGGGGGGGGDEPEKPKPIPPDGRSFGDPHFETFDGAGYNFQAVGEYTLVRSTKDDFTVQVRQVPALGPRIASNNQAVATRIGGQRLTFALENGSVSVRLDGKVVSDSLPRLKAGSLTRALTSYGAVYLVTWPDETQLRVQQLGKEALNVNVRPSLSRKGTLEGLLGDFDGSPDNDLVGKNKVNLGKAPSADDLNHSFADAWRIKQSDSLFDYAPGQSTKTFLDPDFPAKDADAARLSNYADAEKQCRAHGITDQHLLDNCILDLAVTNSFVFGSQYEHQQQMLAARAALTHPPTPPSLPTLWMSGEILDSTSEPEFHFEGKQGDVIWIHGPDCVDNSGQHPVALNLLDPGGKLIAGGMGCEFRRAELPVTGTYTMKAIFRYRNETTKYRIPIRFTRPDRQQQISYGQMVSGNIETPAAHDVYTFQAQQGDVVLLSGQGCELGWMVVSFYDAEGHDWLAPGCRTGTAYTFQKAGTYKLVINSDNAAEPGPYHFVFQGGKVAP